jgi:hypothetical protein
MTRNKLLRRLEALEEIIKPKASEEIPPAAQAVIDRIMANGKKAREEIEKMKAAGKSSEPKTNTPEGEKHEK